ncbi:MAG: Zn-ribbon domain-containing OB-fold protein [Gammaproteobacteria bacterium]
MTRFLPEDWFVPQIDARNRAFFTSGTLALQACEGCGAVQHPPEDVCHRCQGMAFTTRVAAPRGTVYSFVVVHHAVHPALAAAVPYAVALVSLDEYPQVRITGNLPGLDPAAIRIGMPVRAVWEQVRDDDGNPLLMPQWVPA